MFNKTYLALFNLLVDFENSAETKELHSHLKKVEAWKMMKYDSMLKVLEFKEHKRRSEENHSEDQLTEDLKSIKEAEELNHTLLKSAESKSDGQMVEQY